MRNAFASELLNIAQQREDVCLLSGDIGNRMFDKFKEIAPNRFINCGIAEANMMSMAAGMALKGLRPFVYTITPFVTTRCLEQIKIGLAYHNAPVIIVGTGSGLSYAELGPTHHSFEDMAILNSIPGIRVLAPCDQNELISYMRESINFNGPTYIRIGKKGEPKLHTSEKNIYIGQATEFIKGDKFLILSLGPIISEAIEASSKLKANLGVTSSVVSLGSLKPLDEQFLKKKLSENYKYWVTLEEHSVMGGLGMNIADWLQKNSYGNKIKLIKLAIQDTFIHKLGNQKYMRSKCGLDSGSIFENLKNLC
tara:strand:- start:9755 stop:10681 length:927 start_codon:yes stop_codon:yes gene_type:complete